MPPAPYCIAAAASQPALEASLEHSDAGIYKDTHPWHWARELWQAARQGDETLILLLATGAPLEFRWWGEVQDIDVIEFRRGTWETRCGFAALRPMHAIFQPLDSIALYPGTEQRRREALEPVTPHRQFLDARLLHPYAICETPAFIALADAADSCAAVKAPGP